MPFCTGGIDDEHAAALRIGIVFEPELKVAFPNALSRNGPLHNIGDTNSALILSTWIRYSELRRRWRCVCLPTELRL